MQERIAFFGTPDWAVPSLMSLAEAGYDIGAVVTNPDRPKGRGYEVQPSPVKKAALEKGLTVWQPASARDPSFKTSLEELAPEACVVVAYGKILPGDLLGVPPRGFVNVHFSLLPAGRGAAPVQRAVMQGLDATGVSIMVLTEGMDEGPVLSRRAEEIRSDDTAGSVGERLAVSGADLLVATLEPYLAGRLQAEEQDHSAATYASKITTEEARIDWNESAHVIHDKIRGLNPAPGAWTTLRSQRLKIHRSSPAGTSEAAPGRLVVTKTGLLAGTGDGDLEIIEAQLAGKRSMTGIEIARGQRIDGTEVLGG